MATLEAKVNTFDDPERLVKWARAVGLHEDETVLRRLHGLHKPTEETHSKYFPNIIDIS